MTKFFHSAQILTQQCLMSILSSIFVGKSILLFQLLQLFNQSLQSETVFRVECMDLIAEEGDGDFMSGGMDRKREFQQVVLHSGHIIVHSRVEEGDHDLLLDEGHPLEFSITNLMRSQRVLLVRCRHFVMVNLIAQFFPHFLYSLFTFGPAFNDSIFQFFGPCLQNFEDNFLTLVVGKWFLVSKNLYEPFFNNFQTAVNVRIHHTQYLRFDDVLIFGIGFIEDFIHIWYRIVGQQSRAFVITSNNLQIVHDRLTQGIRHFPCLFIAHPDMHTSASREDKHEFMKSKILLKGSGKYFLGNEHKFPAQRAGFLAITAGSHVIVVIHIEIEYELSLHWLELLVIFGWRSGPHGPSINFPGRLFIN